MSSILSMLDRCKLTSDTGAEDVKTAKPAKEYKKSYISFPFGVSCSCFREFSIDCVIGVPFEETEISYGKVKVPSNIEGYFYLHIINNYNGFESYIENKEGRIIFYNFNDFLEGVKSIRGISYIFGLVNTLYLLTRQYSTQSLSLNSNYIDENSAGIQGHIEGTGLVITKAGTLRDTVSVVYTTEYTIRVRRKLLGVSYIKSISENKINYTSSYERSLKLKEVSADVINLLKIHGYTEYNIVPKQIETSMETEKLLGVVCLPFPTYEVLQIRRSDLRRLGGKSETIQVFIAYIEVYANNKKVGYVHGYNARTFEVRKMSLIQGRMEFMIDSKLKCSDSETMKLNNTLDLLRLHNPGYEFLVRHYTMDKFILANNIK